MESGFSARAWVGREDATCSCRLFELTRFMIPPRAATDAAHIGLAAAHGMDFFLTWNCRHIHSSFIERRLAGTCQAMGFSLPVLCTPRELMAK